jgi:hypothetical protein
VGIAGYALGLDLGSLTLLTTTGAVMALAASR